jgi:FAD/FMN-containing dehydrogenase
MIASNGFELHFQPGDSGYETPRKIWNASIDKYPGIIARCSGVADVVAAVNFARENELLVAVRGGGYNVSGKALCDDPKNFFCLNQNIKLGENAR